MTEEGIFDVGRKIIYWIMAGFVLSILLLSLILIFSNYKSRLTSVPAEIKGGFIALRFINSPACFAYGDENPNEPNPIRTYLSTIDLRKFTPQQMSKCYLTDKDKGYRNFNFKLTLRNFGNELKTNNYFNIPHFTLEFPVLVWSGSGFVLDQLLIEVQENLPSPKEP